MAGAALVRLTRRAYRGGRALKVSRGDGFDGRSQPLSGSNRAMTWAFVDRGAGAVIQSRPRWTESLHGDSAGVVALKTCCRHTSAGQELGRLVPGRGRCGGMRPPTIQVTVPSGSSAVPVALGTYEVRVPSPCLERDDRGDPHAHGDGGDNFDRAVLEDLSASQTHWNVTRGECGLVAQVVVLPVEMGGVKGVAVRLDEKCWVTVCSKRLGVGRETGDEVVWMVCQHQIHLSNARDEHCRCRPVSRLFQLVTSDRLQKRAGIGERPRHKRAGAVVSRTP